MKIGPSSLLFLSILAIGSCDYKPRNQGRALYEKECQSCHMEQGQGLGKLFPPVAKSDYVLQHKDQLACLIRNGIAGDMLVNGQLYSGEMAGNSQLTEIEINNLVHYILVDLNDQKEAYQISDIKAQLQACKQ